MTVSVDEAPRRARWSPRRALGLAALAYAVLTALLFRALLPDLATHLPSDLGDPLLNTAILQWNATHVPLTSSWWDFPAFAPATGVTSFTEHLLGAYAIASPVIWMSGNPVLAYNVVLLSSFVLNGVAAYALARRLTGRGGAAFVAGVAFAFAPYHAVHVSHLQMVMAFGMPAALLGLHQYVEDGQRRGLALAGIGWLLAALSSGYAMAFFPLLVAWWFAWFGWSNLRRALTALAVLVAATVPVLPVLLGYAARHAEYGLARGYGEIRAFSADMLGLASASFLLELWGRVLPDRLEGSLFPGLVAAVLAVAAVAQARRRAAAAERPVAARASMAIGLVSVVAAALAVTRALPGVQPFRLFTIAAAAAIVAAVVSPAFRDGWKRRDPALFYAAAAVALWLIALGPEPVWNGARALAYGPYRLIVDLPGAHELRVPARAWLVGVLCLSMLASLGAAAVMAWAPGRQATVAGLLAAAIFAEGWFGATTVAAPSVASFIAVPANARVLHLPADDLVVNARGQYLAVAQGHRTLNGYSGYVPPHYERFTGLLKTMAPGGLDAYRQQDDLYVVAWNAEGAARWVRAHPGAVPLGRTAEWDAYRLPRR